jgi:thymidine phosphorylase
VRGAGVDLLRKLGDAVGRSEPLYRVYAEHPSDLRFAKDWARAGSGYAIGDRFEAREFAEF